MNNRLYRFGDIINSTGKDGFDMKNIATYEPENKNRGVMIF
jgi:hypothetical protein